MGGFYVVSSPQMVDVRPSTERFGAGGFTSLDGTSKLKVNKRRGVRRPEQDQRKRCNHIHGKERRDR